jgi:tetratricopeptide (TPR) repeat protein
MSQDRAAEGSTAPAPREQGAAAPAPPRWRTRLAAAIIIAASAGVYANSFQGQFVFDDLSSITQSDDLRHLWPPWHMFVAKTYFARPVLGLTFAANYVLGGSDPWGYHAVNLVIHVAAALVLFGLVRRTLRTERVRERFGRAADTVALAVALLWTVHPLQTQAVTYVVQRGESLMGLFYLLTLYALVRATEAPEPSEGRAPLRVAAKQAAEQAPKQAAKQAAEQAPKQAAEQAPKQAAKQRVWYGVAVAACALGMGTKQVMVTAPLVVLLYDRTFLAGTFREAWRRRWGLYLGLAATWLLLAQYVLRAGASVLEPQGPGPLYPMPTTWEYLATQAGVVAHYLRLAFWPEGLCLDYGWPVARTLGEVAPPAVLVGVLLGLTVWAAWRRPATGFLGAWFFLVLAPTSSVVPMEDAAFEHRMYLPLAAVVTAVVVAAYLLGRALLGLCPARAGRGTRIVGWGLAVAALAAVAVPLGWRTVLRNEDYCSPLAMWSHIVAQRPDNARAHCNLGIYLYAEKQVEQAVREYDLAIALRPRYAAPYSNRSVVFREMGRLPEALRDCNAAIQRNPAFAEAYNNRGNVWLAMEQYDRAIADYTKAAELAPDYAVAYSNRSSAYHKKGQLDEAIRDGTRALELDPALTDAWFNRAMAYRNRGLFDQAIQDFTQAIELDPRDALAYHYRANAYQHKGQLDQAIRDHTKALGLKPDLVAACNDRGVAFQALGRMDLAIQDYTRAIQLEPDHPDAYFNRGVAHALLGLTAQAVADYSKTVELNPDFAKAYHNRAACYLKIKDYDKAWADIRMCRRLGYIVPPPLVKALQEASGRSD